MQILTNHIGYEQKGSKQAILMTTQLELPNKTASLVCAKSHQVVATLDLVDQGKVANWHTGNYYCIDFSSYSKLGSFYICYDTTRSEVFRIDQFLLMRNTFSDVLHYFKSQRSGGIFDQKDAEVTLLGSNKTADVRGGWYDASGDVSKYLSHLSYANYLNPQQTPMVVWNMLKGLSLLDGNCHFPSFSRLRLTEEALYGADFLVRMQDEKGFFYTTVFDKWSKDINQREICAYSSQKGHKSSDYQAGFRQGAGVSIAALAAAPRLNENGEFNSEIYLKCAINGYQHLLEHNLEYLDDGEQNIIDEYCALLASTELYRATKNQFYLAESRKWANALSNRQHSDNIMQNYWAANNDKSRPFYHASDAGLPVIALSEYLSIEPNDGQKNSIKSTVEFAMIFEVMITKKTINPFGYPRQFVLSSDGDKQDTFFIPHKNESGYWWQGENARIASLVTAAMLSLPYVDSPQLKQQLSEYAQNGLNWILGLNPFDLCMLDGHGRNNPDYLPEQGFFNAKGGICNGITSGFEDESDIAFNPKKQKNDMLQNWRWGEQWIPHSAWYLLAIISQFHMQNSKNKKDQQ